MRAVSIARVILILRWQWQRRNEGTQDDPSCGTISFGIQCWISFSAISQIKSCWTGLPVAVEALIHDAIAFSSCGVNCCAGSFASLLDFPPFNRRCNVAFETPSSFAAWSNMSHPWRPQFLFVLFFRPLRPLHWWEGPWQLYTCTWIWNLTIAVSLCTTSHYVPTDPTEQHNALRNLGKGLWYDRSDHKRTHEILVQLKCNRNKKQFVELGLNVWSESGQPFPCLPFLIFSNKAIGVNRDQRDQGQTQSLNHFPTTFPPRIHSSPTE